MPYMTVASNFTGKTGKSYTAGASVNVDPPDVADAIRNNGSLIDLGDPNYLAVTLPSGSSHNYSPNGFSPALKFLAVTCNSSGSTLGGLQAGTDGQMLVISNVSAGAYTLTLTHLDASSSAANQFQANADVSVSQNNSAIAVYSATLGKWLICGLT